MKKVILKKLKFKKECMCDKSSAYAMAYPLGKHGYPRYCLEGNLPEFDLKLKKSTEFTLWEIWEDGYETKLFELQPMTYKHAKKFANKFWKQQYKVMKRNGDI